MASSRSNTTRKSLPAPSCLVACITPFSQLAPFNRARPGRPPEQVLGLAQPSWPAQVHPRVATEPRGLAPRELAGVPYRLLLALSQGDAVLHVGQNFAVAQRLARRARDAGGPGGQRPHLVHQACLDHAAKRAAIRRSISSRRHGEPDLGVPAGRVGLEPGTERREGPARPERDLQGADDPPPIGGLHPRRTHRIELGQAGVQVGRPGPAIVQFGLQRGGHVRVATRDGEVVDDRAQVEPGATDQQRMMPARRNALQRRPRRLLELGDGEVLVRVDEVEQMVRHGGPRRGAGLRRPDVHAAVHAHGIDGDDLAVTPSAGASAQGVLGLPRGGVTPTRCDRGPAARHRDAHRDAGAAPAHLLRRRPERWWGCPSVTVTRANAPGGLGVPAGPSRPGSGSACPGGCESPTVQHRLVAAGSTPSTRASSLRPTRRAWCRARAEYGPPPS